MSDCPHKIYADRGPQGGWMYREERMPDTEYVFTRADNNRELVEALEKLKPLVTTLATWGVTGHDALKIVEQALTKYTTPTKENSDE